MPFNVGPIELIIVLVIALLVVGPRRLPEMGNALGKTIREFRNASSDVKDAASPSEAMPPNTLRDEAKPNASSQPSSTGSTAGHKSNDA